ncbi:MAG: hypothetical protein JSV87_02980 [Candidatus Bathyarchaeota archaeon]|nr:MAG: hypothetical protein JSV87_02980 [Candidatus Bathyarchaeota archaeon]
MPDEYFSTGKTPGVGSFFSGLIDDVRIYNVALSAEEVAALPQYANLRKQTPNIVKGLAF